MQKPTRRFNSRTCFASTAVLAIAFVAGAQQREEVIRQIKDFERTLQFEETGNFKRQKESKEAYFRCYYTGKFELPSSYDDLKLRYGDQNGCPINEEKYDVFFYRIEAVASGNAPVTSSLESASLERLLVVVPHEDFHVDKQIQSLPAAFAEAASTLIGFLTANEFARANMPAADVSGEAELFLQKAELTNAYYGALKRLYDSVRAGSISKRDALARKKKLFQEMQNKCEAIHPDPKSFNKCLSANNNAGLAFEMTYTKYYPLMHELYEATGQDLEKTIEAIRKPADRQVSEEETLHYFRELGISGRCCLF